MALGSGLALAAFLVPCFHHMPSPSFTTPHPPPAMIELKDDQLRFSFPALKRDLRSLLDAHTSQTLPAILAEDRSDAARKFLDTHRRYSATPARYKARALKVAAHLTDAAIRDALSSEASRAVAYQLQDAGNVTITFQRTLRIPDDGRDYPLPPGLGHFPLRHIDDFADSVPSPWLERGGVLMPMYQSEALWLHFRSTYPIALKVASGKMSAITGAPWQEGLNTHPQDYLVLPEQPWLDGFAVAKGIIRQFVATPLGAGYSVEEQLSGRAEFGGIQLQAFPMKAAVYFENELRQYLPRRLADLLPGLLPEPPESERLYGARIPFSKRSKAGAAVDCCLGLGAGGRMKQDIYADPHDPTEWDLAQSSRCFVHLCDSLLWREITGEQPPHTPVTAREYERAGYPWFDYYRDDVAVLEGSKTLAGVQSVAQISAAKGDKAIPNNDNVVPATTLHCGPKPRPGTVREWAPL